MPKRYLTFSDVVWIHGEILSRFGGLPGFLDRGRVEAAVGRLQTGYYNNIFEEAAALMESIANNHGFVDGNKRTAFGAADNFLRINGFFLSADPEPACSFITQAMAEHALEFSLILEWIFQTAERLPKHRRS